MSNAIQKIPPGEKLGLSCREAAALLGISEPALYALAQSRPDFPSFKINRRVIISREGLAEWVRKEAGANG